MYCKKCGHERQAGEKFCPVCGTPFPEEDGNQDVVPNVTSANQGSEGNAIDNNVVADTPARKEPSPIVNNYNDGSSYSPTSEPTKSSNKPALITFCVLMLVIIFGVTVSVLSSSGSSESSADNTESVNTTDNSGSAEQGSEDDNSGSDNSTSETGASDEEEAWNYALSKTFIGKDGSTIRITRNGVFRDGLCLATDPQLVTFGNGVAIFNASTPTGYTMIFSVEEGSDNFACTFK